MNDQQYVEENIEDFFPSSSSDEVNNAIKEILEKNGSLQEEVRKLKREQEIHSTRLFEILEQRNKMKDEIDGKNNEIQNQSLQLENLIDQISNASEEIMTLRLENERIRDEMKYEKKISLTLVNDLNTERKINESLENELISEKQVNERMVKSQKVMDQDRKSVV